MTTIRPATLEDAEAIATIGKLSYSNAFGRFFTDGELERYLQLTYSVEKIQSSLQKPINRYFIAELDEKPAAFMKLKYPCLNDLLKAPRQLELQKIYVLPDLTGAGIGSRLMDKCAEEARAFSPISVWLIVWEGNEAALRFYHRLGYQEYRRSHFFFETKRIDYCLLVKDM